MYMLFCLLSCSVRTSAQSEDEPIGWFELEDDWNDVQIKLHQCRIAKVAQHHTIISTFFNPCGFFSPVFSAFYPS